MQRYKIIETIGKEYLTTNTERDEFSYPQEAGGREQLKSKVGHAVKHEFLDLRFQKDDIVVLVETKKNYVKSDEDQLKEYQEEENALFPSNKVICILANTNNNKLKVWKSFVDDEHFLANEDVLDNMQHYINLFKTKNINNKEIVLKNTYSLNELLNKYDIDEKLRSQFVGSCLLYIKSTLDAHGISTVSEESLTWLVDMWKNMSSSVMVAAIKDSLSSLLDGTENKTKKIQLLQKNILENQKIQSLTNERWIDILTRILFDIYKYINTNSSEGQDILNLFFIAFNKYTGKADKNQAFTPDHITEFMCRLVDIDHAKTVLDPTCGSGSFLVQAMVKEMADCGSKYSFDEKQKIISRIKKSQIYGIEVEEKAFGLATTNILIHGDGNSNIVLGNCFEKRDFIKKADPDIILMNPPYNAKPINIPDEYKADWGASRNGMTDPTKGLVFVKYLSDIIKELNNDRISRGNSKKTVKMAVLLPVAVAIATKGLLKSEKELILLDNTLEAVFTLNESIFYPGASVNACCMLFTLGEPHIKADGTVRETFFGFCKEDGFKKKKNLGRVEQFDEDGNSRWKEIEEEWLRLFRNRKSIDGFSAMAEVTAKDEWLCEAHMKTDYTKLCEEDFQRTLNNYLAYLVKEGKVYES